MPYLSQRDREKLLDDLKKMNFMKAKSKLRKMDPNGKIGLYRNVQNNGEWVTRYDLKGLGTIVTLIESRKVPGGGPDVREYPDYRLVKVIVEPTADNRT